MASLLDTVIANSTTNIYKVENDVNKIDAIAGARDAAEMLKMGRSLKEAAIQRASLDTSNGKVAVMVAVGPNGEKLPWHKLGTMVVNAINSADAARLAGINWKVSKVPARYAFGDSVRESSSTFILYREDTGAELGSVGRVYKPIQNSEGFAFLDDVLKEYGAKYETAGAIYGGQQVWMQARLPESCWEVQRGDAIETFATFTLSHDGLAACRCIPSTLRAVCANTLRMATKGRKGISLSHKGDIKRKIAEAKSALRLSVDGFRVFQEVSSLMVKTKLEVKSYANVVLDEVLDITAEQAAMGAELLAKATGKSGKDKVEAAEKFQKQIDERKSLLDDIIERYHSPRCSPNGSTWAAFNAVTEHADHFSRRQRGSDQDRLSRKFESVLVGDADDMKQVAYEYAVQSLN